MAFIVGTGMLLSFPFISTPIVESWVQWTCDDIVHPDNKATTLYCSILVKSSMVQVYLSYNDWGLNPQSSLQLKLTSLTSSWLRLKVQVICGRFLFTISPSLWPNKPFTFALVYVNTFGPTDHSLVSTVVQCSTKGKSMVGKTPWIAVVQFHCLHDQV